MDFFVFNSTLKRETFTEFHVFFQPGLYKRYMLMTSLQGWLDRYLKSLEIDNASLYTIKNYGIDIGQFITYCRDSGITTVEKLDRDIVRKFLTALDDLVHVRASLARSVFELHAFGDYLLRNKAWEQNVFRRVYAPRVPRKLPRYLSIEDMDLLLQVCDTTTPAGLRNQAILEVLYASGVRVSEIAGLNLDKVDLASGELRVVGKGDKERVVLLGHPAVIVLRQYIDTARPQLTGKRVTNAVFLNRFGGRLSSRSVDEIVRKAGEAAGLQQTVTPHLLRHTFATHMLNGGADLRVLQELLGHENLATTQIYASITQRRIREIYLHAHPRSKIDGG
ncbi:MAG: tyrosine recombinase XerC [Anaerolineales bacterium]|nr:MAG: tyrosine recombinase XerC [Anaerolineales bacterium]